MGQTTLMQGVVTDLLLQQVINHDMRKLNAKVAMESFNRVLE